MIEEEKFKRQVLDIFRSFLDNRNIRNEYILEVEKFLVGATQEVGGLQHSAYDLISGTFVWLNNMTSWHEVNLLWQKEISSLVFLIKLLNKDLLSYPEILTALKQNTTTEEVAL